MCEAVYQSNSCWESSDDQMSPTHRRTVPQLQIQNSPHQMKHDSLAHHDAQNDDPGDPRGRHFLAGAARARARCLRL